MARRSEQLDVGAAKALLTKLVATPDAPPPEERQPEPEISPEQAAREVALSLSAFADLARMKQLGAEAIELLKSAVRAFVADDLQPRPPPDLKADRVDPGSLAAIGESPASPAPATERDANVIPIRH